MAGEPTDPKRFLDLRDERPRIDDCVERLRAALDRATAEGAERLLRIVAEIEQRLGDAASALDAEREAVAAEELRTPREPRAGAA